MSSNNNSTHNNGQKTSSSAADTFGDSVKGLMDKVPHLTTTSTKKRIAASFQQLQEENKSLKGERKNLANRIDEETNVLQVLIDQASGLKKILSEKDVEINALNYTIKDQSESIRTFQTRVQEEENTNKSLVERLDSLTETKEKLEEKEQTLTVDLLSTQNTLALERAEIDRLKETLHREEIKLSEEIGQHRETVERSEQTIASLSQQIANHQSAIEDYMKQCEAFTRQVATMGEEAEGLQSAIASLNKQINELSDERDQISTTLQEEKEKLANLETLHNQLQAKNQELVVNLEIEWGIKAELESKLSDITIKYEELSKLVIREQATNEALESDKTLLESEKDSLQVDNESMKREIDSMREELSNRASQINELSMIRVNLNMEIEGVRRSHIKEMEELTEQIQEANEQLEANKTLLAQCVAEIETLTSEKADLAEQLATVTETAQEQRIELEKQKLTITQLESNLQEKILENTSLNRTSQELEYLKETLKNENQAIRDMITQGTSGLDERLAEKDEFLKRIHGLDLTVMDKNNKIEDGLREITTLKERVSTVSNEVEDLKHQLEVEKKKREDEVEKNKQERDNISKRHLEEQIDKEQAAELVINDLKKIIDKINNDKDIMESELNNFAQRLSDQSEKVHEFEQTNAELQKDIDTIVQTRDNLIKELDEIQSKKVDNANREVEERLARDFNDLRVKSEEEKQKYSKQLNEERQTWESRRWETVAELEQEKNRNKKVQEELLEERRRLGVVSKTVEKFLQESQNENVTAESFYAMLEAARKELLDGFQHRLKYHDDEDLLSQLHMEREARKLAESQVEHFAVLLEKKRMELMSLRPIDSRNGANNSGGFFSSLIGTFKEYNSEEPTIINPNGSKNFLKRTFTGTQRK
eukprot:gene3598-4121_t